MKIVSLFFNALFLLSLLVHSNNDFVKNEKQIVVWNLKVTD